MSDSISKAYRQLVTENIQVNYSPSRSDYSGPLHGELINSPNLSVDDHLKAINHHQDAIARIADGSYPFKFPATENDKARLILNHKALISAHKDQIDALGNQGNYRKD